MNPQSHPNATRSDTLFSEVVPGALKGLVDRYGTGLLGDAGRLRGLLQDEVPQARKEISVLLLALEEHVPQDLMRVHSGEPISSLSPRLARRLTDDKALSPEAARWAVNAWAQGLGVESVLLSQPVQADAGLAHQEGQPVDTFTAHSAANQRFSGGGSARSNPTPRPVLLADSRLRLGAGALVALLLAVVGWWFLQPRLEISRVETAGVLIGNGRPQAVYVDFEARNTQVRSAELRLVKGDGEWAQTNWKVDVVPDAANPSRVTAGQLQVKASKPLSATFEVTLVAADGKRSAPYQRSFDVLPPLLISKVNVPRPLLVGKEFAVDINFQKGAAEIVRVERKVIDSSLPWAQNESVQTIKLPADSTRFDYRFEAFGKPTRSTIEFTLVDAAGVRSDPVRVALNVGVAAPPAAPGTGLGTVVSVRQAAAPQKESSGLGAFFGGIVGAVTGNQVGKGGGRTVATIAGAVGGAWAGNEIEKRAGSNPGVTYETTVRLDDGQSRVISTRGVPPWREGTRISWDGRELSPAPR